jgi:pimeloyl-ACP methyl ester carboxylesterase
MRKSDRSAIIRQSRMVLALAAAAVTVGLFASAPATALTAGRLPGAASSPVSRSAGSRGLRSWSGYIRSTDGVRLWVHSVGGGASGAKVVVLVHGGPGLSLTYLSIFDRLASPARRIVSYDQRGSGRSTKPADHDYRLAAQVSDLEAVRHWTGAEQVTILGHSWGGLLAAAYTALHPAHVAALALVDALPLNWAAFLAGENRIGKRITALQGEGLIPNPLPPILHNSCLARDEALTPAYLANPREHVSAPAVWGSSCTYSTDVRTFNAFDHDRGQLPKLAAALGTWRGRALVMQGAGDPFGLQWLRTSVAELHSATTKQLAVPKAGHFPWIEQPSLVLQTVGQFTR